MWADRWDGGHICLNGLPLVGRTANRARDSILLHLMLHSLPEFNIHGGTSSRAGKANDELTLGNIAIVVIARRPWINEFSFR